MCALALLPVLFLARGIEAPAQQVDEAAAGPATRSTWRAWLEVPGGELPFGLELVPSPEGGWIAEILNEPERIPVPDVAWDGESLVLELATFDSRIRARREARDGGGALLVGEWEKVRGPDKVARVPFRASEGYGERFAPAGDAPPASVAGRWRVQFESDPLPAVGVFEQEPGASLVRGTFLTATGDYRYLSGRVDGARLSLSCFDGGHAFLFDAQLDAEGRLAGDFHSGNWWSETWTAVRDDGAALGDAFEQTTWRAGTSLAEILLPDLDGHMRVLADPELLGRATVLQLFGSWCPNCHDETVYLVELFERYRERGLSIVGVAFELTGELERDAAQVKLFADRYGVTWPILLAGTAGKAAASLAFPAIDRLRSYPTTIFLDGRGRARAVHSGFAGPATGEAHVALRSEFEARIEGLLAEEQAMGTDRDAAAWAHLTDRPWISRAEFAGATCTFHTTAEGRRTATYVVHGSGRPVLHEETFAVRVRGDTVWLGGTPWILDRPARVLRSAYRFGGRLVQEGGSITPLLEERGLVGVQAVTTALGHADPLVRREAIVALVDLGPRDRAHVSLLVPLLQDQDPTVRLAATWALGSRGDASAVPALLEQLDHPHAALRRETVHALVNLSEHAPEVTEALLALRDDPDQLVREAVSRHLREDGPAEPGSTEIDRRD